MSDFQKKFGKAICVGLYAVVAYLAGKKHPVPLIVLVATHIGEYFVKARKIAKEHAIDQITAFVNCVCFGFAWWLPIKESEKEELE